MDRRHLLRALAVAGLAGCTPARPLTGAAPDATPTAPTSSAPSATAPAPDAAATADPEPTPEPSASPSPEPSSEPSPTPGTGGRTVEAIDRDALGLPTARDGGTAHTITGLMLHHTAAPTAAAATAPDRWRGHTRSHREAGFVDVAYHWGIDVDGNVYQLRDESIAGETYTSYDPAGWFLVVCEGNFEESAPPQAMLEAVADVFAYGAAKFGVAASTLVGHRDRAATACPGANLQSLLADLQRAVEARVAAGGITLAVVHDPARVAAIEAG